MITITALPNRLISIGRSGENEHRRVAFDISEYLAQYPDATFGLIHSPSGVTAYPVATVAVENDQLIWTVTSSDVTSEGQGRCELIVRQGDTIAKSIIYMTQVFPALDAAGEAPEPWESWQERMIGIAADVDASADRAEAASEAVQNLGVSAETLEPGSDVSVEKMIDPDTGKITLKFGITEGLPGADGYSPRVVVTDIEGGHRITITDASGTLSFDVMDGQKGDPGDPGQPGDKGDPGDDGFSPTASVSKSGSIATITITDKDGTTTAQVSDGAAGCPGAKGDPGDDYVLTNEDKAEIAEIAKDELIVATVAETKQYIGIA